MIYKCMNCGGNVVYDPQSGHMKCMSCGGSDCEQSIPSETPMICPACGTQITYRNEYGSAGKCPACGVPIIRDDFIVYPYGPDVILPFKVSKRDAEEKLQRFVHGPPATENTQRHPILMSTANCISSITVSLLMLRSRCRMVLWI